MEQDWETVTFRSKKTPNTKKAVSQARQQGHQIETTKRFNAGANKQSASPTNVSKLLDTPSIDQEGERLALKTVSREQSRAIQQGRQNKNLTQRDLATRVNVKVSVINEYESCKATPNVQLLAKMERVLGVKLRGKDIGAPLERRGQKKETS